MRMSRGFTLIEVIISIFIVGVMLLLLDAVIRSGTLVNTSKHQGVALAIARSELEQVRAGGYDALPASGSFSDSLLDTLPPAATATVTVDSYSAKTKQVTVVVEWLDPGLSASSTVSLATLITQVGGLP